MAGHSKFKNIQFRKGAQDKKRSKIFSKLSRDITLAAKGGVPDPTANARLRLAIANARAESMPKDNIDRAIKKALGGETDTYEEIRYEGFGPGGVGLIVEVLTDNRNRAAANVRTAFNKNGLSDATPNKRISVGLRFKITNPYGPPLPPAALNPHCFYLCNTS